MAKLENIMTAEEIKQKIWTVFDLLRNESIPPEHYYVILFLLSLHKDSIISKDTFSNHVDIQENLIRNINSKKNQRYLTISQSFIPTIKRISSKGLIGIYEVLSGINKNDLTENFLGIFDNILYHISRSQGGFGGEYIQPIELTRFISQLTNLKEKSKVFNPFAGLASFGVFLDDGHEYYGQELNHKLWAIGALRIMAFKRSGISRYSCTDSIQNWPKEDEKFDVVIANPPYGMRLSQQFIEVEPNISTVEQFLIEKGVNSLNTKGKLIALLPQGFLFRGKHEQRLREQLIEEDLIDTIISLPGGLLMNTGIPLIVLVIDKDKKLPGKVRFIDAKKFVESKSSKEKILNVYGLNSVVHESYNDSDIVRLIDLMQIREFDYNLNVPRYFQKHIEGVKLKDIFKSVREARRDIPDEGKMIRISDIKDEKLDFKLDLSQVENTLLRRPHLRLIDESCLLLSTRWKSLKPTFFEFSGEAIFLNPDILSFKINEQLADTAYLINELHADYVEEQLASYRHGATIPMIERDDLLEVIIRLPSLEEQRAKVQGIVELSDRIKILQQELNALTLGNQVAAFNELASLKHSLGTPRQNILSNAKSLIRFFESNNSLAFSEVKDLYNKRYETNLVSDLIQIKDDVNHISSILEKGENGLILENYELKPISIQEIIDKALKNTRKAIGNYKPQYKEPLENEISGKAIKANITLFKVLVDNILSNADKYAFDSKKGTNQLVIELKATEDFLEFEIRNNGIPFPNNFNKDNFIKKFSSTSVNNDSGLGGYDINRIAKYFKNPEWELILNNEDIFPVVFRFSFPIISSINE